MLETIDNKSLVVILGPTASGKTKLAVNLAAKIGGEIISADSRQVYKGMNIGTGKDFQDYLPVFKQNSAWPAGIEGLYLVDNIEAGDSYNVAFFQRDFQKAFQEIISRGKTPILCGGTGMYIEAVLRDYEDTQVPIDEEFRVFLITKTDEELTLIFKEKYASFCHNSDISTRKRLIRAIEIGKWRAKNGKGGERILNAIANYKILVFGIDIPTEIRRERITTRLKIRLNEGMIDEVRGLLESGISAEKLIFYGLEYKFITEYLLGELAYDEMVKRLEIAIHQFAKRQMTFFRSMERKGIKINWLDGMKPLEEMTEQLLGILRN
ncbi:tRNA dimethylallyltransferase [Emticicia oligotrophica DSM 17448]|uniref:tRNA dimethylallyltransferase n=1 Tax=Emticicia oligotrophica (strain DSM 17448 / CIP 109782 / MTCC 6937 / GPTSA100-15) TaxID=929562 RepID=A0ABN4AJK9_EMTOG|nr:tRNA (adenosine(37)-N6)-dimethylallyltransferase MiaA [Emticicia oligotrophica]AFK02282.1 tRNA dimethylallyltransferase [Emticicia oligotrophica DSM 17448]